MTQDDDLQLSGIQHFSFCRRQWALIHIEDQWQENGLTAEGRVQHDRVHDESISDFRGGVLTLRGMRIRSDRLRVSGVCDAVEFTPDPDGIALRGREGLWRPCPVEYKHGAGKLSDCDRLQLAAQALCLEEMLCCEIPAGALCYWKTRRRERVEIDAGRIDDKPALYSGGMQQRLQIARNLVTSPRLVFMDEPTGGLDVSVQARLLDLLRHLVLDMDLAVILVTHDLAVARLLSHRLIVMYRGEVVETGLTDQVLDDPHHAYTQLLVSSILQG